MPEVRSERLEAEPEYANCKTAVWWDMDSCPVPEGYDPRRVRPSIEGALKSLGYNGPVTIKAKGNLENIPGHVLQGIASTGIVVEHMVSEMVGADIFTELMFFKLQNKPPAAIMLISDLVESELSYSLALDQQDAGGFNLLLAYTKSSKKPKTLFTRAEWRWKTILAPKKQKTRRFVLQKCSGSGESSGSSESVSFWCYSCNYTAPSVTDFSSHLSTETHKQKEIIVIESRKPDPSYIDHPEYFSDEEEKQSKAAKAPKSKKRSRKALRGARES